MKPEASNRNNQSKKKANSVIELAFLPLNTYAISIIF